MALARLGLPFEAVRGRVGGLELRGGRGRAIIRTRTNPRPTATDALRNARTRFTEAADAYRALTEAQREAWIAWADQIMPGPNDTNPQRADGRNWFMASHTARSAAGLPQVALPSDPGQPIPSPYVGTLDVNPGETTGRWYTLGPVPFFSQDDDNLSVYTSPPVPLTGGRGPRTWTLRASLANAQPGPGLFTPPLDVPLAEPAPALAVLPHASRRTIDSGYVGELYTTATETGPSGSQSQSAWRVFDPTLTNNAWGWDNAGNARYTAIIADIPIETTNQEQGIVINTLGDLGTFLFQTNGIEVFFDPVTALEPISRVVERQIETVNRNGQPAYVRFV